MGFDTPKTNVNGGPRSSCIGDRLYTDKVDKVPNITKYNFILDQINFGKNSSLEEKLVLAREKGLPMGFTSDITGKQYYLVTYQSTGRIGYRLRDD